MAQPEQYKKEYCQMLIDHMALGYSITSFGALIGKGRTTLYAWIEKHAEFKEASEIGLAMALKEKEMILRAKATGLEIKGTDLKKIDTACLLFWLKTRGRKEYSEKFEMDLTVPSEIKLAYNNE